MLTTTTLSSGVDARLRPTALERQRGRYLRSPDGHGDAGAGDGGGASGDAGASGGDAAAAADGGSGDAGGDQGEAGTGAAGGDGPGAAGDGASGEAAGDKPGTILGEAAAGEAGDGKEGEGDGAKDGAEGGEEGEGGSSIEVLGAPEKYDLKLSDEATAAGMTFDKEAFEAVEPILRELNLSNDAAQALVGAYAEKVLPLLEKRAGERWDTTGADMRKGWEDQAKADPDIGGAKFNETKTLARQTFVRFGVKSDGPFLKLLEESGLGSHPDMLRFVANVGRLTGEASTDGGSGGQQQTRLADRVYGAPTPRE